MWMSVKKMTTPRLPPIDEEKYRSCYKRDYRISSDTPRDRAVPRPTSLHRRHNPQSKRAFLFKRLQNKHVCDVWTSPDLLPATPPAPPPPVPRVKKVMNTGPLKSSMQLAYCLPPNFVATIPERHKFNPAIGIVPATALWQGPDPIEVKTGSGPRVSYVLNQALGQDEAVKDMQSRAKDAPHQLKHFPKPSRRRVFHDEGNITGSGLQVGETAAEDMGNKAEFYALHKDTKWRSHWVGPL